MVNEDQTGLAEVVEGPQAGLKAEGAALAQKPD